MLKPQWWVNCKPLAEEAIKVSRCYSFIFSAVLYKMMAFFFSVPGPASSI
jgi:hypothetical protein